MARILVIDAGTTGVRAIIFAADGSRLAGAYRCAWSRRVSLAPPAEH